ncbi:MAG: TrmJ/YjtD family RNA methyltransferase [Theionarchaea archaeon]|nr:TrmJ/YjtD family RNA methyltransferase [Theionarchaea archaeon]MBU7037804.1 TrmJ/YjtD family RNA methyltransferase [Theionarchaea archaeon]
MISVIFVEPESAGNVGSIARCMKNFGASQLILVNPCPLEGAEKMAQHGTDILEKAVIVTTLDRALVMVDTSIAATAVTSGLFRASLSPSDIRTVSTGHIGIVIGRESRGLTAEEIEQCDLVMSIPASQEYPVLNAAAACCIVLYEFFQSTYQGVESCSNETKKRILAECRTISDLMEKRPHRKRIWEIVLKRVLSKAFLSEREATILLGFFRRIRTVLTPLSKP